MVDFFSYCFIFFVFLLLTFFPSANYGVQFYEGLANQAATNGHIVDLYAFAFDQTGIHEMRHLPNYTGYVWCSANSFL